MKNKSTICVHSGSLEDTQFKGAVSPVFPSTAYAYEGTDITRYPRYFNIPNQRAVEKKMAQLENTEEALSFSSGIAALMTVFLSFLRTGDHIILQEAIYGGTYDAVLKEFERFNIEVSFCKGNAMEIAAEIKDNTRVIFIETPSNPLLELTDIEAVASLAKEKNIISVIDNTFASPINQNPHDLGIDIVVHSGTKYLGGHSDICCGVATMTEEHKEVVKETGIHFGGSLDARTAALLERSLKTLEIRIERQNKNALTLAQALEKEPWIKNVYYPGLPSHPQHSLAKKQMSGFGGMLSFDVAIDPTRFTSQLRLIKAVVSLGGVESTISSPVKTSHARVDITEREKMGITPALLRLSVGIENADDLINDLKEAAN